MSKRRRALQSLARRLFRSWISAPTRPGMVARPSELAVGNRTKQKMRPIRFEPLETRELMAADFYSSASSSLVDPGLSSIPNVNSASMSSSGLNGEGEAAIDKVAFAKALKDAGVIFYGAIWCPFCNDQKNLFEDGYKFLRFVEVTNPDHSINSVGTANGITTFPTWEFPGKPDKVTGVQTLEQLSALSGVAIPKSSTPSFATIADQTVLTGSPLHVPVDAYDPNGNPLTITVSSSNPSLVTAEVLQGNKSATISVEGFGDMTFELFDTEVPRPAGRFIQLAQQGFYNKTASNSVIFHRVIDNFVIQAGDPTGTGSGGSSLGKFDDQFDVDLQHNQTGVLSYAKSSDDTNDSQFFITEGPQRNLDFNHSIFGQLIEGFDRREGISQTPKNSSDKPNIPVVISSVNIFNDTENGLIRLKAVNGQTGSANITVTVTDTEGNSTQQTFKVTVAADTKNSAPFLNPVVVPQATQGSPVNIQLSSQDVEGDPVYYDASVPTGSQYTVNVNNTTGLVTLTPNAGFTGAMTATVGVRALNGADTVDAFDTQAITVSAAPLAPTGIDLLAASDTGASDSDNITNSGSMSFVVSGTVSGATVNLRINNTTVGTAVATGATTTITTNNIAALGAATYSIVANQTLNSQTSADSTPLSLTYDNVQPVALATGQIPATGNVGTPISVNLSHAEEGSGLVYSLTSAPAGMTINASTGVLAWTPTSAQVGAQTFSVVITDRAGNTRSQSNTITVSDTAQGSFEINLVDLNGNPITSLSLAQSFKVQIYVNDLRTAPQGVFSAFVDLLYNSSVVELDGATPLSHGTIYTNTATGDTNTLGTINEFGGVSNTTSPQGEGKKLLGEIRMRTKAVGTAVFTTDAADNVGSEFLVYGSNSKVDPARISFGTASLGVGLDFTLVNDVFSFNEDTKNNSLTVLQNDTVQAGSTSVLTIQSVSAGSASGTLTVAADGKSILYSPAANFNGTETFTYTARNQAGATSTASVTVQVQPVNDPPTAVADAIDVIQDSSENFVSVLSNDTFTPDTNETLRVTLVGTPTQGGTVRIASSGNNVFYTPKTGFVGTDTFTYTVSDGSATSQATVTVTVKPSVPPPTAVLDLFTVVEDAAAADFAVLTNDTPSQTGETLSINSATATIGTVTVSSDGQKINYKPKANYNGTEVVTYKLKGSLGGIATGTVTFTITPVNDAPVSVADTFSPLSTDATTTLTVLQNDTDPDNGDVLTITAVTQPASGAGTVAISSDKKSLIYTPASANFEGTANFTYTIGDGSTLTSTANVILNLLSYVKRDIGGVLRLAEVDSAVSTNNNSAVYVNSLSLTGTDFQNRAVSQTLPVVAGQFSAQNLAPGNYVLSTQPLPFLSGGNTSIQVQSNKTDGSSLANKITVGSLSAAYFDIRDFVGINIGKGLTVAAVPGTPSAWANGQGNWKNFKNVQVTLNSDRTSLNIQATKPDNTVVSSQLPTTPGKADLIASDGTAHLYRLRVDPNELSFTTVPTPSTNTSVNSSSNNSGGEGEGTSRLASSPSVKTPAVVAPPLSSALTTGLSMMGQGEGESVVTPNDVAMSQIKSDIQLVSPAGDFIAQQRATSSSEDVAKATDSAFSSLEDLLLT